MERERTYLVRLTVRVEIQIEVMSAGGLNRRIDGVLIILGCRLKLCDCKHHMPH